MSHNTWVHRVVRPALRPLARSPVTPNHITCLRLLAGLSAAAAFAQGDDLWRNVGAGIFVISFLLDRADGELARLKRAHSALGHRLDLLSDGLSNSLALFGLGIGLRDGDFGTWAIAMGGVAGLAVAGAFAMIVRMENLEGRQRAAELPSVAGFDPDDAMLLVPAFVWLGLGDLLLLLAAAGAPLFCAVFALVLRRRLSDGGARGQEQPARVPKASPGGRDIGSANDGRQ